MKTLRLESYKSQITRKMLGQVVDVPSDKVIYVFDFDGVLASPIEDLVYKLPKTTDDKHFLERAAGYFGIDYGLFDQSYLRHIILQNALLRRHHPIDVGPLCTLAADLSRNGEPIFVLSARSAPSAVSRALGFLNTHSINAQETFFVGRVGKGRQLSMLQTQSKGKHIVYFDDSIRHSRNAFGQKAETIISVHLGWRRRDLYSEAVTLYKDCIEWLMGEMEGDVKIAAR